MSSRSRQLPLLRIAEPSLALALLLPALGCGVDDSPSVSVHPKNERVEPGGTAAPDFVEVSLAAGLRDETSTKLVTASYGALWVDLDDNGALDLVFMNHGKRPELWLNRSDRTFTNIHDSSGLKYGNPAYFHQWDRHGAACADFDNDGNVDLFIAHGGGRGRTLGVKSDELLRQRSGGLVFDDIAADAGTKNTHGRARFPTWVDVDNDGFLDLYIGNAQTANVLYRNRGDGTFSDATTAAHLGLIEENGHGWADFDRDGDVDLVALPPLRLYRNDGGVFSLVEQDASGLRGSGRAVSTADFDGDGLTDIFVTALWPSDNRLFRNVGGRFETVAGDFGPAEGAVCKGSVWGDIDNDSFVDLVIACSDRAYLVQTSDSGELRYRPLHLGGDYPCESDANVALGDFDNDGFVDLAMISAAGNHLFRNAATSGNWLELRLRGTASNRMGFGARIRVELSDGRALHSEYFGDTGHFASMGCGPVHMGLGDHQVADVEVSWPSGTIQRIDDVAANQTVEVVEPP
jgi:hypothetical protein